MNGLKARLATLTTSLIVYCILFVAAIPVLCISVMGEAINIPLMVISIVVLGAGLALIPLGWIQFARLSSVRRLTAAVEGEHIYEVSALTERLGMSRRRVIRRIKRMLRMKILRNYFFDGSIIHPTYRLGAEEE